MDNLTLSYKGNQLIKADDSTPDPTLFSRNFRDVKGSSIEYIYDVNGNLTKDLNKGITQIRYSLLNLPKKVNFNHTGQPENEYTYAVDGSKLQVNHKKSSGSKVTDYVGNMIYEGGSLKRILVDGGFYEEGKYYFYLRDHLGNNRVVADASGNAIQVTHYYPFGMSFTEGFEKKDIKPAKQPYKYNGKELDGENSLNWYDYEARQLAMDVPRFTTVDPMAENYFSWSPYVYVGNNPMRFIDPTGMYWVDEESRKYAESLTKNIQEEIDSKQKSLDKLNAKIEKGQAKGKDVSKKQKKVASMQADIDNLNSSVSEITAMGETKDQAFAFTKISGEKGGAEKRRDGVIQMDIAGYGSTANGIHESTHGYDLWKNGDNSRDNYIGREIKAYSRQYSYNSSSLPKSYWGGVNSLQDITSNWVIGAYTQLSGGGRHYLYGEFLLGKRLYSPSYIEKFLKSKKK